jgi:autotransporter-associated beta strand protein
VELAGGTLTVSNIIHTGSTGSRFFNFNGGTLKPFNSSAAFFPSGLTRANVRNGGAIIDTDTSSVTIAPPLLHSTNVVDAAIDGGLTKNGNGTLTLIGVPGYTGPTRVNGGRLITPLPAASSSLVLAAGTRFSPALTNAALLADSAALTNATVDFNYGSFSANPNTNASFYLTNLALSGSVTCNIVGTGFPVTNLTLLSYGSKTGGGTFVLGSLPTGMAATLNDDGANVTLNITSPSIQSLIWSTGDGIWKTNGAANWNSGTATYLEYPSGMNDAVTFDDTASGTVTITGQVKPSATTVNVTSSSYTFGGAGSIGGTNGIAKLGTGTLRVDNANNFTGPVTISGGSGTTGGTIFVNNHSALGATSGTVTVNGPANTLEIGIAGGSGITVSNKTVVINGTGVGGARGALRGAAVAAGQTNIWAGPVTIGADNSRIGTEDNGNLVVAGNITDNGANFGLFLRPGGNSTVIIAGTNNSYAYTRIFGDATTSYIKLGANNALPASLLALGPGNLDLNGFNQAVAGINDSFGVGTIINNGASAVTLTINTGTNSASAFFLDGNLVDGTSTFNIVKSGKGSQTAAHSAVRERRRTRSRSRRIQSLHSTRPRRAALRRTPLTPPPRPSRLRSPRPQPTRRSCSTRPTASPVRRRTSRSWVRPPGSSTSRTGTRS